MSTASSSFLHRDFDTLQAELLKRIETKYGDVYNDFQQSGMGMMLVDLVAFAAEVVCFYIDRRAKESYLSLAMERANISRLTRQNGYVMRPAVSASGSLLVAPETAQTVEVLIPAGFQFQTGSGVIFETTEALLFPVGSTTAQVVAIREGRTFTVVRSSTGEADQEIALSGVSGDGEFLCKDSVVVLVDGETWEGVDFLRFEEGNEYEVLYLEEPPLIRFGNGISGVIPPTGSEIRVTYVECSGRAGNVSGITSVVTPLTLGSTTVKLTITQTEVASGGDDPEGVEEAKAKAPGYIATRGVAVTREDYYALAGAFSDAQYGAVAVAQAYVARTLVGDIEANNYMSDIEGAFDVYGSETTTGAQSITQQMDAIAALLVTMASKLSLSSAATGSVQTNVETVISDARGVIGRVAILNGAQTVLEDYLEAESADILTLDELLAAMSASSDANIVALVGDVQDLKEALTGAKDTIDGARQALLVLANGMLSACDTIVTERASLDSYLSDLGEEVDGVGAAEVAAKALSDALPAMITTQRETMETLFASMRAHLDEVLSADGFSNVITVPILAVDADGYYAAPSSGLIRALEEYLSERSDVAHMIQVISGADTMIAVDVAVEVRVLTGYVFSEIATQIDTLLRTELKRRRFGDDLYVSRVHQLVQTVIGVDVFNIAFTSEEGLDGHGNLLIGEESVIIPGEIRVTQI